MMKQNFIFLDEMLPGIRWDAKYATWDNFTGKPVDGYEVNRIVGTKELGAALRKAQKLARKQGYGCSYGMVIALSVPWIVFCIGRHYRRII